MDGYSWQMSYGDGSSCAGKVFLDQVTIGDLTVQNQAIEAASTMSLLYSIDPYRDGLIGLGFSKYNSVKPKPQLNFFDNIRPSLAAPVFTAQIKRQAAGTYHADPNAKLVF
jgi:aspergillopepsin I